MWKALAYLGASIAMSLAMGIAGVYLILAAVVAGTAPYAFVRNRCSRL